MALLILALPSFSQEEGGEQIKTIFDSSGDIDHGGYGAPFVKYANLLDQDALLVGGRGAWMIDHRFGLGLAGFGVASTVRNSEYMDYLREDRGYVNIRNERFEMGYGGILLEPILYYQSPVHVSFPVIIGAGGAAYSYRQEHTFPGPNDDDDEFDRFSREFTHGAAFFVMEPGVEVELNIHRLIRFNVGATYLYVSNVDLPKTDTGDIRGFTGHMGIKIGKF